MLVCSRWKVRKVSTENSMIFFTVFSSLKVWSHNLRTDMNPHRYDPNDVRW